MRVLILSANTGGGHNSTAQSLAEQMEKLGMEYEIADALALISEKASSLISNGHVMIYKHFPALFGWVYRFEEKHPPRFIYDQCAKGADSLNKKLEEGQYDAVICVHVFAAMMLTEVRERFSNNIPSYFIATDYTASPGVSELRMDGYFIPHRLLHYDFVRSMIAADKMHATGIPVRRSFFEQLDREEVRRALHLPTEGHMVLVGGGSMGCGHLEKNAMLLKKNLPENAFLVILCGHNQKAYEYLQAQADEQVIALSFTDRIAEYMSAADLYITKPGGLTTSEAIAKRLPMLLIDVVPGCESRNYSFLTEHGIATGARSWKDAARKIADVLADTETLEKQRAAMESFGLQGAAEAICRQILKK